MTTLNAKSIAEDLAIIVVEWAEINGIEAETKDFESAGVVSNDEGFVIKIGNKEFQVTVVRSK